MRNINKPANWENSSFEDLFTIEAGQAYVAEQFGSFIEPDQKFRSDRTNSDACTYLLFEDRSLWYSNNAQDEVWTDVLDFVNELSFEGLYWDDCEDRDGLIVDAMDRDLLVHLWGEEEAKEFFEKTGGIVPTEAE